MSINNKKPYRPVTEAGSSKAEKTAGWRSEKPIVDEDACISCGLCAKFCPDGCILMGKSAGKLVAKIDYDYCKGCGICAAECPTKAIVMEQEKKKQKYYKK